MNATGVKLRHFCKEDYHAIVTTEIYDINKSKGNLVVKEIRLKYSLLIDIMRETRMIVIMKASPNNRFIT